MMPYTAGMAKTARLEFRVEPALKARLEAEADRRGQKLTTFVERAVESALSDVPGTNPPKVAASAVSPGVSSAPSRASVELAENYARAEGVPSSAGVSQVASPRYGPKRDVRPIPKEKS